MAHRPVRAGDDGHVRAAFVQAAPSTRSSGFGRPVGQIFSLYALSTINFLAFIIPVDGAGAEHHPPWRERQARRLGARFKTRDRRLFPGAVAAARDLLFLETTGLITAASTNGSRCPATKC